MQALITLPALAVWLALVTLILQHWKDGEESESSYSDCMYPSEEEEDA